MLKKILSVLSFTLFVLSAQAQTSTGSFMHDGVQRDYVLHIPANYTGSSAVPLILNFHGFGGNGSQQLNNSGFAAVADTAGFIVVSPTGTPLGGLLNHWNVGGWTQTSSTDDVSFASALIDSIAANYNVDMMRVYSTGFSNGGFFSHRLASDLGHRIAAIASVSGTFTPQMETGFAPTHPTPVLQIHGTTDPTVPYDGTTLNFGMASVDTVLDYWINYNNCNTTPTITALPDLNTSDGSTVERFVYAGGDAGVTVEHLKITNGAHDWPGASGNMDINASVEIWKFFSRYSNTAVGLNELVDANKFINIYPNPTTDFITLENSSDQDFSYQLCTLLGKQVQSGKVKKGTSQLDLSNLPSSIYFLKVNSSMFKILKTN